MTGIPIVRRIAPFTSLLVGWHRRRALARRPGLHALWQQRDRLPRLVAESPVAMRYLELLGPLAWNCFPERNLQRNWGQIAVPYATFAAACLIKLDQGLGSMGDLRQFLVEHPVLVWLLGFPLTPSSRASWGFDAAASLPTQRHFTHMLRAIPNSVLQFLLDDTVRLIRAELTACGAECSQCIALDTKHILAWVKENNPKAYVAERFDKTKQPKGDPDCRLGCKRKHNQRTASPEPPHTPSRYPVAADSVKVGEYYWGYGSGIVAIQVPGWGEFVLAELTQPFDHADVSYFFPLMSQAERRLGFKPPLGALDAAFDAWYVYEYFHLAGGFAAVPFSEKGGYKAKGRQFSADGLPVCAAAKPMPLKFTYTDRSTTIIEHERGKYVCPLLFPQPSGETCPVQHKKWYKGGCTAMMPTSIGARLRYTLDRDSQAYKGIYRQRTTTERINSQAVELGIERPHIRNGQAVANINTLVYTLINLRMLQRIRQR